MADVPPAEHIAFPEEGATFDNVARSTLASGHAQGDDAFVVLPSSPQNLWDTPSEPRSDRATGNTNQDSIKDFPPFRAATRPIPSPPADAVAAAVSALARHTPSPLSLTGNSMETRGSNKKMSPGETSAWHKKKKKSAGPCIAL